LIFKIKIERNKWPDPFVPNFLLSRTACGSIFHLIIPDFLSPGLAERDQDSQDQEKNSGAQESRMIGRQTDHIDAAGFKSDKLIVFEKNRR
jgi:hypothetical protein